MKKLMLLGAVLSSFVFASEAMGGGHTDIIPRTINFLIFVAILWYLVGDKAKRFFAERKERIAKRFQEIEEKLKESKAKKEALKAQVNEAKQMAHEIVETAKKEAELIEKKIKTQLEEEIAMLERHFEEFKQNEIKKTKQEAVKEYMEEIFKEVHITSEDAAKLVLKAA
ncbi:F0F1 ATP synthase subunit B [Caminibacter pacificus]|jgi:F-type H+-transporting ATPase subunit b|uniref:ATP synthase subunit b n=1 Tax=Caminibacter pacificus TaxID=1424653 RepID=A0AAJ4RCH6_9BACT|nr:F0F1 ATP synthase subunit B [Caminibacter pacificus]NPA87487.1 F0F1 ATP synthase subunit B [Campylobacterota bacterium]QCI27894.1 F0F1 ATP synthase subunit B [Caminibacter pacificus]ROR39928.1 F-type H+-transporting ATPase subunit b [Caminibacter pacificus]